MLQDPVLNGLDASFRRDLRSKMGAELRLPARAFQEDDETPSNRQRQLPGSMDGVKLANAVRDRWPPILIIVVSGHHNVQSGELPDNVTFLTKPYSERQIHQALSWIG